MTCQAPPPCGMTLLLGRSPEAITKGRQESIKRTPTHITLDSPSPSPSPDYIPFTPINPPNSYNSNTSYHIQFDEELTKIDK